MTGAAVETPWLVGFESSAGDLERQVYRGVRDAILAGRLKPGARLPSTRGLAASLGLSRGTVVAAFDQLAAEGYVEGARGRGTSVRGLEPELASATAEPHSEPPAQSTRAAAFAAAGTVSAPEPRCFRPGWPSLEDFPRAIWARCLAARARAVRTADLGYTRAAGLPILQAALVEHLNRARGVVAEPDQVIVVPSAQAAFAAIGVCTSDPGDTIAVENPGYPGITRVLAAADVRLAPTPVDADGLVVGDLARHDRLRLVAVTPSHQHPTGVTMSLERRLELLEAVRAAGAFVLEDDFDSEYRYAERPIAALQGIDRGGSVIYVGTFSKLLAPGIRVACMVAPRQIAPALAATVIALGQVVSQPVQAALADFITEGYLAAHVNRMRPAYEEKRDLLIAGLEASLPPAAIVSRPRGGLQLLVRLPDGADDVGLAAALATRGLASAPLSPMCLGEPQRGLVLGFALPRTDEIAAAAVRLGAVVRRHI